MKTNGSIESQMEFKYSDQGRSSNNLNESITRPFKCQRCDLTFDRASQYDYHHRSIHLGEKSQLCEICGKGFFRKADLQTHLNIHLGTNVCICEVCGRKFNHISNLIRHSRMHAGIKPYPCCVCGKRFIQISSLARHKLIHEKHKENSKYQSENTISDKFVKGNASTQPKVVRRQHYCKICGESFNFIYLLREHEKSHLQCTSMLEYKNNEMKITELEEHQLQMNNFDNSEKEIDFKKPLPLEAIIYITSEQLKQINLETIGDIKNHTLPEHLKESDEKIETVEKLNDETTHLTSNSSTLICKPNDYKLKENVVCVCQEDEPMFKSSYMQVCESELQKIDMVQNPNALPDTPLNVTDMFQKIDLSESNINECIKSDLNIEKYEEINSVQNEKDSGDAYINNTTNYDEPMLRLVQTETGEQFYEFLISNLVEKLPNGQSAKYPEDKEQNMNVSGNVISSIKTISDEIHQDVQDDMQYDVNYTQYELQGEEKHYVSNITNQNLLDSHAEFDKYVETNFEVFEKLNYDESSERFLEFVEITEAGVQNSKSLDCKDNEQFLRFQNFNQSDALAENEKNIIENSEQIPLTAFNEDTQCETSMVNNQTLMKDESPLQAKDIIKCNEKLENLQQELKRTKICLIKFQCTVCEKSFSNSYNYKQHIGTHFADQQKFHCKECKVSFAWKSTLNKHIANNHRPDGPQKFACDVCNKTYNTVSQVNEHVKRDHLKQRDHVCSYCDKSFFKKHDLKIHKRIHTDERPYVCRACGKRFHHRSHIIRHERIHF